MKLKKFLALFLAALTLTTMLAACGDDEDKKKEEEDKGAEIDMYFGVRPDDFDPSVYATNSDKFKITSLLFEGLTTVNEKGKVEKLGASDWDWEIDERDDELKLTIKLAGAVWSDGIAVRADDYIYAWRRILKPDNNNPAAALLYPIKNAQKIKTGEKSEFDDFGAMAVNNSTLVITFENKNADVEYFLKCLASPMLVPLREEYASKEDWSVTPATFVSNGPFTIKQITSDRLMIERNANYGGRRTVDKPDKCVTPYRINAHFIPAVAEGDKDISDKEIAQIEADALKLYNSKSVLDKYYYIGDFSKDAYNKNKADITTTDDLATYTYYFNTTNALLSSANTRKALSAALDRKEIAKLRGCGAEAATGLVPTGVLEPDSKDSFRETSGKNLLNYGSVKADKTGSLTLIYNSTRAYEKEIAEYAKKQWEALGFKITLKGVKSYEIDEIILSGEFDIVGADFVSLTNDAFGYVVPFAKNYSGSSINVEEPALYKAHFTGYDSKEYNEIIKSVMTLTKKTGKNRASLFHKAEEKLLADAPVAPLFFEKNNSMTSDELSKVETSSRGMTVFTKTKLKDYKEINEMRKEAEIAAEKEAEGKK